MAHGIDGRTFFRIVKTDPPTVDDFLSAEARGMIPPVELSDDLRRLWDGISVYATAAQARRKARQSPILGRYIVELRLWPDTGLRVERTARGPGHHTIWGQPGDIQACVVSVVAFDARSRGA